MADGAQSAQHMMPLNNADLELRGITQVWSAMSGQIVSRHALNEGPRTAKTHCSGLVVLRLTCPARHGERAAEKGQEKKRCARVVPRVLASPYPCVFVQSAASDGDFIAQTKAQISSPAAPDMCWQIWRFQYSRVIGLKSQLYLSYQAL